MTKLVTYNTNHH